MSNNGQEYIDPLLEQFQSDFSESSQQNEYMENILDQYPQKMPVTVLLDYINSERKLKQKLQSIKNLQILDFYPDGDYQDQFAMIVNGKEIARSVLNYNNSFISNRSIKVSIRSYDKIKRNPHKLQQQFLRQQYKKKRQGIQIKIAQPQQKKDNKQIKKSHQYVQPKVQVINDIKRQLKDQMKEKKQQIKNIQNNTKSIQIQPKEKMIWIAIKKGFDFNTIKKSILIDQLVKNYKIDSSKLGQFKKLQNTQNACIGIRFQVEQTLSKELLLQKGKLQLQIYKS